MHEAVRAHYPRMLAAFALVSSALRALDRAADRAAVSGAPPPPPPPRGDRRRRR